VKTEDPSASPATDILPTTTGSKRKEAKKRRAKTEPKKSSFSKKKTESSRKRESRRSKSLVQKRERGKVSGKEMRSKSQSKDQSKKKKVEHRGTRGTRRSSRRNRAIIDNNDQTCRYCFKGHTEQFPLYCCDNPDCTASIHQRCLRKKSDDRNGLYEVTRFPESWLKSFPEWYCPSCAPDLLRVPMQNKLSRKLLDQKEWPLKKNQEKWLRVHPEHQIAWSYGESK